MIVYRQLVPTIFIHLFLFNYFPDTCHFQKLLDDTKTNEFDFHWNTSPKAIVCAFPYIIAFTSNSMEIRLLVNGNLVHVVQMAELQLITSKRDIYFVTTAPEIISKDFRIKGLDNEVGEIDPTITTLSAHASPSMLSASTSNRTNKISDISNERILEIKHKIEKLEAQINSDLITKPTNQNMHINSTDNLNRLLPTPYNNGNQIIQRARSLQKHRDRSRERLTEDAKRVISKSNSCGDSYGYGNPIDGELSPSKQFTESNAPPNTPRVLTSESPSPTGRHNSRFLTGRNSQADMESPTKVKPLRIYRIPLANLTGTHSHYHTHNSCLTAPKVSKIQSNKIVEDHSEGDESVWGTGSTNAIEPLALCHDITEFTRNLDEITCNCTNLSLFTSL